MNTRQTFEFVEPLRAIEQTPESAQMLTRGVPPTDLLQRLGVIDVDSRRQCDVSSVLKASSVFARDMAVLSGAVRPWHDGARP